MSISPDTSAWWAMSVPPMLSLRCTLMPCASRACAYISPSSTCSVKFFEPMRKSAASAATASSGISVSASSSRKRIATSMGWVNDRWCADYTAGLQRLQRLEHVARVRAHLEVLGVRRPAHDAGAIDHDRGRHRNVLAILAAALVDQTELARHAQI